MPTATGFVIGFAGGTRFTSTFLINDIQYHFSGNLNPAAQEFEVKIARLEYNDLGELTAQRAFDGQVGTQSILFTIRNGPRISGTLNQAVQPASRVSGTGTWSQN